MTLSSDDITILLSGGAERVRSRVISDILVLLAVKLGEPGLLSDIEEAYRRLDPNPSLGTDIKPLIKDQLVNLERSRMIHLYSGRRYMLTDKGVDRLAMSGLRAKVDQRRMYLLKETRRNSLAARSDTRNRLLKQRP